MKLIDSLILKYESKLAAYERAVAGNQGTTKNLCIAQRDLCLEILKDLKCETSFRVKKEYKPRKKGLRPAKRKSLNP